MATLSNGQLAVRVNDLVSFVQSRHGQLDEWMNGVVNGGDFSNGTYPLTDNLGVTIYVRCPAQLEEEVDGNIDSATTAAIAAAADAVSSSNAATAAAADAALAEAQKDAALAAQSLAETARDAAVNAETNAIAQKIAAQTAAAEVAEALVFAEHFDITVIDGGLLADLLLFLWVDGADFGLITTPVSGGTNLGYIAAPIINYQNIGTLV